MKLFISQPTRDKTDEQIKEERNKAIVDAVKKTKALELIDFDVIDRFFEGSPAKATPLWCLGKNIKLLRRADIVYFCKDWEKSNGCIIEHECAVRYGKKCIYA